MTLKPKEVLALLRKGESETVEFKEGFDRQVIETLAAFANTKGGKVLLGVSDSGEVTGVELGKESAQNWINQIKQSTGNGLFPDTERLRLKGKPVFVLSVPEHPIKPVACGGRYFKITGKPEREERWDYPLEALREIVINAIVHRDYSCSSDSIVKIFDDRLEVFNPGTLQPGLTIENLLKGDYVSVVRNRKIADIFKEAGLIEKYGTGIRRVLDAFRNHGLPTPKFEEISGGFRVTAYRVPDVGDTDRFREGVSTQATTQATTQVGENTLRLLQFCEEPATLSELMTNLGYRSRKHFRTAILDRAMKGGLIERTAPDKPHSPLQHYRLTERGKEALTAALSSGQTS